jgi:hypothetical protein
VLLDFSKRIDGLTGVPQIAIELMMQERAPLQRTDERFLLEGWSMGESLIGVLSMGYVADRLAHAVGWSPLARMVEISNVEGPAASLLEGVIGTARAVEERALIVEPDRTIHPDWGQGCRLRLTARHEGWTPRSLCLRPIAVVVETEPLNGRQLPVAVAIATIVRRPRRAGRD